MHRLFRSCRLARSLAAAICFFPVALPAVTLDDLRADAKLTPRRFARYFADFQFRAAGEVQAPENFLATASGDCDDYATLAADVLAEKGYTTRLISVRMPHTTHVVCYVAETHCYLDYNQRAFLIRTVPSDGTLPRVARQVARSFAADWTAATEFTYRDGLKYWVGGLVRDGSVVATDPPAAARPERDIVIDF